MKKLITLMLLMLLVTLSVAQAAVLTFQTVTVSTTAVGLSTGTLFPTNSAGGPSRISSALCSVETNSIRFRYDGMSSLPTSTLVSVPTSTIGHPQAVNTSFTLKTPAECQNLRMISGGSTTAYVTCTGEE